MQYGYMKAVWLGCESIVALGEVLKGLYFLVNYKIQIPVWFVLELGRSPKLIH